MLSKQRTKEHRLFMFTMKWGIKGNKFEIDKETKLLLLLILFSSSTHKIIRFCSREKLRNLEKKFLPRKQKIWCLCLETILICTFLEDSSACSRKLKNWIFVVYLEKLRKAFVFHSRFTRRFQQWIYHASVHWLMSWRFIRVCTFIQAKRTNFHALNRCVQSTEILLILAIIGWKHNMKPASIDFFLASCSTMFAIANVSAFFMRSKMRNQIFSTKQCRHPISPMPRSKLLPFPFVEDFQWHFRSFPKIIFAKPRGKCDIIVSTGRNCLVFISCFGGKKCCWEELAFDNGINKESLSGLSFLCTLKSRYNLFIVVSYVLPQIIDVMNVSRSYFFLIKIAWFT